MADSLHAGPDGISDAARGRPDPTRPTSLKILNERWIQMVDECLESVGAYGEVRLSLGNGRLVGLQATRSYDALKGLAPD